MRVIKEALPTKRHSRSGERLMPLLKREKNRLSEVLTSPASTLNEVDERGLGLLPATGLETTVLEKRIGCKWNVRSE